MFLAEKMNYKSPSSSSPSGNGSVEIFVDKEKQLDCAGCPHGYLRMFGRNDKIETLRCSNNCGTLSMRATKESRCKVCNVMIKLVSFIYKYKALLLLNLACTGKSYCQDEHRMGTWCMCTWSIWRLCNNKRVLSKVWLRNHWKYGKRGSNLWEERRPNS